MEEAAELGYYLSQKDIDICLGFAVETLAEEDGFEGMRGLHDALAIAYKDDDASGAE